MIYLPDTNVCISLLRQRRPSLIARWQSMKVANIRLCSIMVYELRHGAELSSDPSEGHAKLDVFLAVLVAAIRRRVRTEVRSDPHGNTK
jgi:tRNA(fMet)-specific endonuclease VapC